MSSRRRFGMLMRQNVASMTCRAALRRRRLVSTTDRFVEAPGWLMSEMRPGCVKPCTSRECSELFSLFSSFDSDCQSGSFVIRGNRGKLSTRKFDVGVFTQPGVRSGNTNCSSLRPLCRLRSGIALSSSLNCSPAPSRNLRAPRGAN
jgi:hypothetical protein